MLGMGCFLWLRVEGGKDRAVLALYITHDIAI